MELPQDLSSINKELEEFIKQTHKRVIVIGCGGGGSNTIDRLFEIGVHGAELVAINTDVRHLLSVKAHRKILIGKELVKGFGAGKNPKIGEEAAKESENELKQLVSDADVVFITCGLGGGTGTGSAPVVAELAKKAGATVIAICTWPFTNEGKNIWENAEYGLERLEKNVDLLVVIPNDKILELYPDIPLKQAFKAVDSLLANALKEITELLTKTGYINVDFADFRAVVSNAGYGLFGVGESDSENRALEAVERALNNPLIDVDISGAEAALVKITASEDLTPTDVDKILSYVKERISPEATVIYGVSFEEDKKNYVRVSVVITRLKKLPDYMKRIKKGSKKSSTEIKKLEKELGIEIIE